MIYLLIFISIVLGLYFRYHFLVVGILSLCLFLLAYRRSKKWVHLGISLTCFALGVGMSFIAFNYERTSFDAVVVEVKDNYYIASSKLERLYIYEKSNSKEIGDILHLEGEKKELSFTIIESGFDFKDYLSKKGVAYELEVNKEEKIFSNPLRFKAYQDKFLSHFDNETRGIVGSILFSRNEDYESRDNLDSLHLNRLINASGIYYSIYLSFFTFIFTLFFKKKWAKLLGLVLFFPYFISMIGKFSIIRFYAFAVFRYLNEYVLKKKIPFLHYYSLFGCGFILIDYHLVYSDSFILGFSIPLLVQLLSHSFRVSHFIKKRILIYVAVLVFFIPFDIKYHHELFLLSYPFQIILTPIFTTLGVLGIISSYGLGIYPVISLIAKGIFNISKWLVYSKVSIFLPPFNDYIALGYYFLYFVSCYYFSIRFKLIYRYLLTFISVFSILYLSPINSGLTDSVTFINVGQGDACLITHKYTSILIDTGGSIYTDIATECLIPYFKSRRLYDIDLVITTHDDYDHMGALASLREHFTVKDYIKEKEKFPIDINGLRFTNYNTFFTSTSEENDKSLVIGFNLFNTDFLIMGDAPIKVEKEIIKNYKYVPCDILKVGHHGSNTSTCDEFIEFISPKEAIISVGRNYYGHPHKSVLDTLKKNNVKIRTTKQEGSISYISYRFAL